MLDAILNPPSPAEQVVNLFANAEQHALNGCVPTPLDAARADPAVLFRAGGMEPDPAQVELLNCTDADVLVLWTRQFAGKSQVAATLALYNALVRPGSLTLIFSAGQRESKELLRKVRHLRYGLINQHTTQGLSDRWRPRTVARDVTGYKYLLQSLSDPSGLREIYAPTDSQTLIELENGSRILSLPSSSQSGVGFTADLVILDEAKVIRDDLYHSVRATMATRPKRRMIALTTPLGQRGWFWEAWKKCDEARLSGQPEPYRRFKRTCWECPRLDRAFVEKERTLIGEQWFRQEYECAFIDPIGAIFRGEDIDRALQSKEEPYALPW